MEVALAEDQADWLKSTATRCSVCAAVHWVSHAFQAQDRMHFPLHRKHSLLQMRRMVVAVVSSYLDFRIVAVVARNCCPEESSLALFQSPQGTTLAVLLIWMDLKLHP